MERILNDLIGDVRPVVVARVYVVDTKINCFPQHGQRSVSVAGWAEHVVTGQLHRAVSHAGDR